MAGKFEKKTPKKTPDRETKQAPKVWRIIESVFTWLLVVLAVSVMIFTVISVNTFDQANRSLFGYKAFVVLSDSMSTVNGDASKGYFNAGDVVLIKEVDRATLKPGDIIAYRSTNESNYGKVVTHMIRSLTTTADGHPAFVTYGTSTDTDDDNPVTHGYVLGKYQTAIPKVGAFFLFLKTTPGYIVCILLPFLLLIGIQGFNSIRLFKKYKAEQLAELEAKQEAQRQELEAQRQELAQERKRQEEMMEKLLKMQEAMEKAAPDQGQENNGV